MEKRLSKIFNFDRDEKRIKELEQEILECEKIFNEADYNYRENYNPQDALLWDHEVAEAKNHLKIVSLERGFLLERRDSWKNKVYWGVLVSGSIYLIFDLIKWLLGLIVKITCVFKRKQVKRLFQNQSTFFLHRPMNFLWYNNHISFILL